MARLITVKDCISQASLEIGIIQKPVSSVIDSPDADIVQMVALLSNVADEILLDEPYRATLGDEAWIYDQSGNPKAAITADSDVIGFDARLAIDGLKYRFLQAKGLEFGEQMRDFINRLNKLAARVNGRVLDLYGDGGRVQ
jgi:hypothetical protein